MSDFIRVAVVDFHATGYSPAHHCEEQMLTHYRSTIQQGAGIPQAFFILNRAEGSEPMRWQVPGPSRRFGTAPMIVQLDGGINVTLYWPNDRKCQIIYATFKGHLPNSSNRKVRGAVLSWMSTKVHIGHLRIYDST